jgi:hypothetical protein
MTRAGFVESLGMPPEPRDMRAAPLDDLVDALESALRRTLVDLGRERAHERFYAAGLAVSEDPVFVAPTANSEEALERTVARFVALGARPDAVRDAVRWTSVSDWEYHGYEQALFDPVNRILTEIDTIHRAWIWSFPPIDRPGRTTRDVWARVLDTMRGVMVDLDAEDLFALGGDRHGVIVNLWPATAGHDAQLLERAAWFNAPERVRFVQRSLEEAPPPGG